MRDVSDANDGESVGPSATLSSRVGADVAARIRSKAGAGALPLPADAPERCWFGNGTSWDCDGCDEVITPQQTECEVELTESSTLRFHADCLTAWHEVRAEQMTKPA